MVERAEMHISSHLKCQMSISSMKILRYGAVKQELASKCLITMRTAV